MHNQGLYSYMACATLHKYERDMLELSISFRNEWSLTTILRFPRLRMLSFLTSLGKNSGLLTEQTVLAENARLLAIASEESSNCSTTCHTLKQVKENATNNLALCFKSAFNTFSDGVLRFAHCVAP